MQHFEGIRRGCAALMMTLLTTTIAAGQDMRPKAEADRPSLILPAAVLAAGTTFDFASTHLAFRRGCVEGNTPLYGRRPSTARLVAGKAAMAGAGFAAMWFAHKSGNYKLARVFGLLAGGVQLTAGALNSANACGGSR